MSNNFHLQLYRGTTQQNNAYTGPAGELTVDTTLSKLRLHDGSTAGGIEIGGMPTGSIIPYAGSTAPAGYLLCDGSAISRSTYSALFAIIGTTYGAGDGNSTFNLPTKNDCFPSFSSNEYTDLTLGASGSSYTAPANGWVIIVKRTNGANQFVELGIPNGIRFRDSEGESGSAALTSLPVKKGDSFYISYTAGGTLTWFRFVYAEGEQSIIKY